MQKTKNKFFSSNNLPCYFAVSRFPTAAGMSLNATMSGNSASVSAYDALNAFGAGINQQRRKRRVLFSQPQVIEVCKLRERRTIRINA